MDDILKIGIQSIVDVLSESLPPAIYNSIRREVSQITGLESPTAKSRDKEAPIGLLRPILEWLDSENGTPARAQYAYWPAQISPADIFPFKIDKDQVSQVEKRISSLFEDFQDTLTKLQHRDQETAHLWFENFESLLMLYFSALPTPEAVNGDNRDVALYDYIRIKAAFASADALYTRQTPQSKSTGKYLVISGGISGIQNFILHGYGDTRKYRAKLLRGRSFAVSLLAELCADMLCSDIGLPSTSVILNAAGRFTLLAPNTVEACNAIDQVAQKVNEWLIEHTYGETNITLSTLSADRQAFEGEALHDLWNQIERRKEKAKFQKIDLATRGGKIKGYLDGFENEFTPSLCPVCGKRPSQLSMNAREVACKLCRDHIFLGEQLVKNNKLALVQADAAEKHGFNELLVPLFDKYQIVFRPIDDLLKKEPRAVLKCWDLSNTPDGTLAVKFINGYVPVCTAADEKYKAYLSSEESKELRAGQSQTLNLIAFKAQKEKENQKGAFQGVAALGVLKADVDDLGRLMACGLGPERFTLPRLATLSRQMHTYFAVCLPDLLKNEDKGRFNDIYTVFAGGDDLFLIGPWNRVIELAASMRETFARYVCYNERIHFSAGVSLHKSHTPIDLMARLSEEELEKAKSQSDAKNCITLFGETVPWEEMERLNSIKTKLEAWLDDADGTINTAMLFRLNELMAMAEREQRLSETASVEFADMSCAKWRSMVAYTAARNVGQKIRNDPQQKQALAEKVIKDLHDWLETFGGKLKIPVWQILYDRR